MCVILPNVIQEYTIGFAHVHWTVFPHTALSRAPEEVNRPVDVDQGVEVSGRGNRVAMDFAPRVRMENPERDQV